MRLLVPVAGLLLLSLACGWGGGPQSGAGAVSRLERAMGPVPDLVDAHSDTFEDLSDFTVVVEGRFVQPAQGQAWFNALALPCDRPTVTTRGGRPAPLVPMPLKSPSGQGSWQHKTCTPSKPQQGVHYEVAFDGTWVIAQWYAI